MENATAEAFIQYRLKLFAPSGVPIEPAPYSETQVYPAIVYKFMSASGASAGPDGFLVKVDLDYLIVGMTDNDPTLSTVVPLNKCIGQAFGNPGGQGLTGTNQYGSVFAVMPIRPHSLPYVSNSKLVYQQSGWIYRFTVRGNYT